MPVPKIEVIRIAPILDGERAGKRGRICGGKPKEIELGAEKVKIHGGLAGFSTGRIRRPLSKASAGIVLAPAWTFSGMTGGSVVKSRMNFETRSCAFALLWVVIRICR